MLAGRSQALAQRLAGTFTPTAELDTLAAETGAGYAELHRRTQQAQALRSDVTTADVVLLLEMLTLIDMPGPDTGGALRDRYLTLICQSSTPRPPRPCLESLPLTKT